MRFRSSLLSMALLLLLVPEVKAIDIYNTLAQSEAFTTSMDSGTRAALSFKTTSTEFTVDSVQIPIRLDAFNPATSGSLVISIFDATGTSGQPGNIVGTSISTVQVSSLSTTNQTFTFSGLNRTLSPSTNYYITVSSPDITSGVASVGVTASSSGAITTDSLGFATANNNRWGGPYSGMWIIGAVSTVASVPEPSTYALAAIATGVMAAVARRRKARLS
jgi:hypothetical protein